MSIENEHVDMMEEGEHQAAAQSGSAKRKRGPTMCASMSEAKQLDIEFSKNGCAKGPRSAEYKNFACTTVKQKADILVERWDHFSKDQKTEWWNIVKVKYLTS